jgi:CO dehydrogenase maturation factor
MDKQRFLQFQIAESLVEDRDFDLIAMGRSEGPGCYCYANNILKEVLREMVGRYPWVVLDNEAGLENLSRRLVNQVDLLVIVTDPSARGILPVRRLHALAREMGIVYARLVIVVNRLRRPSLPDGMDSLKIELAAHKVVGLTDDEALYGIAEGTGNLRELPMDNPLWDSVDAVLEEIV